MWFFLDGSGYGQVFFLNCLFISVLQSEVTDLNYQEVSHEITLTINYEEVGHEIILASPHFCSCHKHII